MKKQERIDIVNQIIKDIANRGRRFLYSQSKDRVAYFELRNNRLYFVDHYSGESMFMKKGETYKTQKQQRAFSSGGTMWGLINDFKDFIYGDDDSNHNNGYGGLFCPHWGYPPEDMEAIRENAVKIGYLKVQKDDV